MLLCTGTSIPVTAKVVLCGLYGLTLKWVPPRTNTKSVITVPSRRFPPAAILLLELHSVIVVSISASCFNREPRGGVTVVVMDDKLGKANGNLIPG